MPADPLAALLPLLDDERQGLLRGRLAEVAAVADRKARLIAALNAAPDPAGLVRVKAAAERNQRLLEAAAAGVKDVRARLAEVRQSAGTLATYTAEGARQTVSTTVRRDVERRL